MAFDLNRIRASVAEALEVSPEVLGAEVVFEELTEFDSVKALSLMVALDDLGIPLSHDDVSGIRTFADVEKLARAKLGA